MNGQRKKSSDSDDPHAYGDDAKNAELFGRLDRMQTDLKFAVNFKEGDAQPQGDNNTTAYFKRVNGQIEYCFLK